MKNNTSAVKSPFTILLFLYALQIISMVFISQKRIEVFHEKETSICLKKYISPASYFPFLGVLYPVLMNDRIMLITHGNWQYSLKTDQHDFIDWNSLEIRNNGEETSIYVDYNKQMISPNNDSKRKLIDVPKDECFLEKF